MIEGNIYRWSFKTSDDDRFSYWAKSRIAIVHNGRLRDTYWIFDLENCRSTSDGVSWGEDEAASALNLEFIANISDLQKESYDKSNYYADTDVVNLNHANCSSGNFYIRKGALRSAEKMLEVARYKREKAVGEMVWAADAVRRLDNTIRTIERSDAAGALNDIWF